MEKKWFLTNKNEVVAFKYAIVNKNSEIFVCGSSLQKLSKYFDTPISSNNLNIYVSSCKECKPKIYTYSDIYCKLVAVGEEEVVFIPLIHTL